MSIFDSVFGTPDPVAAPTMSDYNRYLWSNRLQNFGAGLVSAGGRGGNWFEGLSAGLSNAARATGQAQNMYARQQAMYDKEERRKADQEIKDILFGKPTAAATAATPNAEGKAGVAPVDRSPGGGLISQISDPTRRALATAAARRGDFNAAYRMATEGTKDPKIYGNAARGFFRYDAKTGSMVRMPMGGAGGTGAGGAAAPGYAGFEKWMKNVISPAQKDAIDSIKDDAVKAALMQQYMNAYRTGRHQDLTAANKTAFDFFERRRFAKNGPTETQQTKTASIMNARKIIDELIAKKVDINQWSGAGVNLFGRSGEADDRRKLLRTAATPTGKDDANYERYRRLITNTPAPAPSAPPAPTNRAPGAGGTTPSAPGAAPKGNQARVPKISYQGRTLTGNPGGTEFYDAEGRVVLRWNGKGWDTVQ